MPKKKTIAKTKESAEKPDKKDINVGERVIELAKKGLTSEKIGLELKKEGIFVKQLAGKRISKILREKRQEINDADLTNLERKVEKLRKHFEKHKHDFTSKRKIVEKDASLRKQRKIKSK